MSRHQTVLILDFGSQFTQLIARRVREQRVYCEILPFNAPLADIAARRPSALILSGGPASVTQDDAPRLTAGLLGLGVPVLGICYGLQAMTQALGGRVARSASREYGRAHVQVDDAADLLADLDEARVQVWMSHGDHVETPAPGFEVLARSQDGVIAAVADRARRLFGVQFHPEVVHTPRGERMLRNFLFRISDLRGDWTPAGFVDEAIARIRAQVGDARVVCGLSGGVDSAVAAMLIHRAIGAQQTCVFVDNGLLRAGEADQVIEIFKDRFHFNLVHIDARETFLSALSGVSDPEQKRKIIGRVFVEVFEEIAAGIPDARFLAQGTLYPDVIESVSVRGPAAVIKSHHNVGGLPERMKLSICEPLRELFKDEVRIAGLELGLPDALVWRQPFPGPGLAIRILGEITAERLEIVRAADLIVQEEIAAAGLTRTLWQAFAVLLPVRTVGVMGDDRTYESVLAIRAVTSVDGMTADWYPLPTEVLGRLSTRIINEVAGVNRVVYDISSKPPATIEWE
ncbi:glutamine-hydrolyzing GMP synthase [Myxococcota bacterium]|nr:glutamine-hydrolyzing GMP synthase [Myxococcota bacterium]